MCCYCGKDIDYYKLKIITDRDGVKPIAYAHWDCFNKEFRKMNEAVEELLANAVHVLEHENSLHQTH